MSTKPSGNGGNGNGAGGSDKVEIIHPPNLLKLKVGSGGVDPHSLARAEAAVAQLADSYLDWALEDLASLQQHLAAAREEPGAPSRHVQALFQTAHDMKGQGATFDYPLVTEVAKSLCHYVEGRQDRGSQPELAVIAAHVDALAVILRQRMSGNGGALGQKLSKELETLVAHKLR